jgi:serine/threonine-protein kinase RsbW
MKIVATELFANAIEHGNKDDATKKLDIAFVVDAEKVKIACVDEGDGFRIESVPDPTTEENLLKDRGRGIHIIKNFADVVLQNDKGNRVTIIKYKKSVK